MQIHIPVRIVLVLTAVVAIAGLFSESHAAGSVKGTATTAEGAAASGAEVRLVELKRKTRTDEQGGFRFENVPAGKYLIEIVSPRYGTDVGQVVVADGQEASVALSIHLAVHHEDVVVSAGVSPQSTADVSQSVAVIDDRDLVQKVEPTLGDTLAHEPGVSATQYAPGASRPIIRGLGGDRIRLLQDGIGVGDASNVSPDHAVTYDPYSAERIEVVRGPATLLYGSNAVGGVVNVLDGRIPDHRTDEPLSGSVQLRAGSNADSTTGAVALGGTSSAFGWHVDFAKTATDDYEAGGDFGTKPNSDVDVENGSAGVSWLGEEAFLGVAFNQYETNYGSAVEPTVRIDMKQKRWDLAGGINAPFGPFRFLKARLGGTDYEHIELEGTAIGTTFLNKSNEGRVELAHEPAGPWTGSFGAQGWTRELEAIGDEAFLAPAKGNGAALFAFEELGTGAVKGQFGARVERQGLTSSDAALRDRDFTAPSGSAGIVWKSEDRYSVAGSLSYSSRVPTTEELYANGPHVATASFEVGDSNLDLERALGFDVALRKLGGRIDGQVGLFYTRFDDYVFEFDTGTTVEIEPGEFLPVVEFRQSAAEFWGGEAHVDFALLHEEPHHLDLELRVDLVHAELTDLHQPVPFQPPVRGSLGLRYQGRAFWASVEGSRSEEQDRFGANDQATPGYTFLNAAVGYRLLTKNLVHDFVLRGTNLTDKLAYASTSRFRFDVPLAGQDVTFAYRLEF